MDRTVGGNKKGVELATIAALWAALIAYMGFLYIPALFSAQISSDIAIVLSFAQRILDGMSAVEGYYDPNPPMSFITYIPAVLLSKLCGIPLYQAHVYYALIWIVASAVTSMLILRSLLADRGMYHLLVVTMLAGLIIVPGLDFGDRDHLIVIGLLPFLLAQIAYLKGKDISQTLKYGAFFMGAVTVLIKPHYGLLPVFLMAVRLWLDRKISTVFRADFYCLAVAVLIYIAVVLLFFRDFAFIILPDILSLYINVRNPVIWPEFMAYGLLISLCFMIAYEGKYDQAAKNTIYLLCALGWLALVVYMVQGKGLNYHRVPYLVFFFSALSLSVYLLLQRFTVPPSLAALSSFGLALIAMLSVTGLPENFITDKQYKEMPVAKIMEEHCPSPCSYFFFQDTSEFVHNLAIYFDAFHTSRFTSLWFLPTILEEEKQGNPEALRLKHKYTAMLVEDFEKFKPDMMILLQGPRYKDIPYEFIAYFSDDPQFRAQINHYEQVDEVSFSRGIYAPGMLSIFTDEKPVTYKIYKRKIEK